MPWSIVNSNEGTSGTATTNPTLGGTASANNLLVLIVGADDYKTGVPSGYTESTGMAQETFLGHYLWWKVAAGGETGASYTIGSASQSAWEMFEISGLEASPLDTSSGQLTATSGGSYTTPSITPTSGDRLLIASIGGSISTADPTGEDTWLNSFTEQQDTFTTGSGTRDIIGMATLQVTADGSTSYSSGASYAGGGQSMQSRTGLIIAFKVAATATSIPYNPQRTVQLRDPGDVQWMQKDPRNALLVASAANPLASPLDVSWQDGGRYWHLYNDLPLRISQAYFTQKDRRGADLVAGASNPLPSPLDSAYQAGGTYWHLYNDASDAAPRTWQSLQRQYVSDPSLGQAPSDPLLGLPDSRRYLTPATHVDRRQAGQQRQYFADIDVTSIIGTGALGAWWGIDDTAHFLVGNLRRYPDLSNLTPGSSHDPVLSAWAVLWQIYNQAALHVDRREVPQQRPYISDPSTYPTGPTPADPLFLLGDTWRHYTTAAYYDRREVPQQPPRWTVYFDAGPGSPPLTLSWGVGGNLWHIYNRAADIVDRVWQPQQRLRLATQELLALIPTANATSTTTVVAGRTSTAAIASRATSTPSVSDG